MAKSDKQKAEKVKLLRLLSLYPLKPSEALEAFMRIDPAKVKVGERKVESDNRGLQLRIK